MSIEFTWSIKVSLEIIRLSTKDGRTDTVRSKRGEKRIPTSTSQNRETGKSSTYKKYSGKTLEKRTVQKRLIIVYFSDG
jgi:hypothetical protein